MDEETAAVMLTNPNTLGIFETDILKISEIVHSKGGLVYCDGANLNAVMGKTKMNRMGVDVLHFNLHKTFSTPHGGGGPGAGPIGVIEKLSPFLPKPIIEHADGKYSMPTISKPRFMNTIICPTTDPVCMSAYLTTSINSKTK